MVSAQMMQELIDRLTLWCLGQTAAGTALQDMVRHKARPSGLVRCSQTAPVVSVEELDHTLEPRLLQGNAHGPRRTRHSHGSVGHGPT